VVVGVNEPIVVVGDAPPIEYWTLTEGVPVTELICETILKASTVNVVKASLVMLNAYHFEPVIAVANGTLNPEPEMPVVAEAQVTPLPLESCVNVSPVTAGATVATGTAGQVTDVIPVYETVAVAPKVIALINNVQKTIALNVVINFFIKSPLIKLAEFITARLS
jgi:hypothetical protein